jgi:hypothetical protein
MHTKTFSLKLTMVVIAGALWTVQAAAQIPSVTLGKPNAASPEEFSVVSGAYEIAPGRLVVADVRARRMVLIDFAAGKSQPLGRNGAGPGEFRAVERFLARAGGGALAIDFFNKRLLPILPDGSIADPVLMPAVNVQLGSADGSGRLYGDMGIFGGGKISDSVRVVRWDPTSGRIDTLFLLDEGRSGMMVRPGESFRPWRNTSKLAALPNGDVLTVSAPDYRFAIMTNGKESKTVMLPFTRVAVTEEDRAAYAKMEDAKPIYNLNGTVSDRPHPKRTYAFPEHFPPFDPDAELLPSADGSFWLERLNSPRDSIGKYDVITPDGRIVARVSIPARSRVIALGKGSVYVAETDADDLVHIKRYPYPAFR